MLNTFNFKPPYVHSNTGVLIQIRALQLSQSVFSGIAKDFSSEL